MNHPAQGSDKDSIWKDDLLGGREEFANFLTNYVVSRTAPEGEDLKPFNIALDAPWGQGKTFFIERWMKDLQAKEVPFNVIHFDAWKADYAADPLIAILAAINKCLEKEINALGLQAKAEKQLSETLKKARRALWPVLKQVGYGFAARYFGANLDEIKEAYETRTIDPITSNADETREIGIEESKKGLDLFFKEYLKDQTNRESVIDDFKASFSATLKIIHDTNKRKAPLFIFVDELDRCRPNFAIELLEGIKHIFGIEGVCFVFSVNLDQLSESVKAVYGSGFNGHMYLKRFFDSEVLLPSANACGLIRLELDKYSSNFNPNNIDTSEPPQGYIETHNTHQDLLTIAVEWVTRVFTIDMRSIPKIIEITSAAITSINSTEKKHNIYIVYLISLCCIRFVSPRDFDEILTGTRLSPPFTSIGALMKNDVSRMAHSQESNNPIKITLHSIFTAFQKHSTLDLNLVKTQDTHIDRYAASFEEYLPTDLAFDILNYRSTMHGPKYHPISNYAKHINMAGQLINKRN
jgi:hypothetical protein